MEGLIRSVAEALIGEVLSRAAKRSSKSLAELQALPQGHQRRRLHDDISVCIIDLRPTGTG